MELAGIEPATSCLPDKRTTRLCYSPKWDGSESRLRTHKTPDSESGDFTNLSISECEDRPVPTSSQTRP